MTLYLVEDDRQERTKEEVSEILERIATVASKSQGELIEALIGGTEGRLFLIIKAIDRASLEQVLENAGLGWQLIKEMRLIGQDLATVRERKDKANYLVQWNLPPGLTMETYLQRKAEKTPLYAQVPEVSFERT
jgi:hypothetical protein